MRRQYRIARNFVMWGGGGAVSCVQGEANSRFSQLFLERAKTKFVT